jgi:hypothetical protein
MYIVVGSKIPNMKENKKSPNKKEEKNTRFRY